MLEHYEKGWKDSDVIAQVQKERGITKTQAVKWLRERIPPERYYQKKIRESFGIVPAVRAASTVA